MAAISSIEGLEQWPLLLAICPLFASDLAWTPQGSDRRDFVVVEESADLFKANIGAIKVLVAGNYSLSESSCADFVARINALLSTLESLVKDVIRDVKTMHVSRQTSNIERRFPKLIALETLMQNPASSLSDHAQYLYLDQDATDFKAIRYEVEKFNIAMSECKNDIVIATETITQIPADQSRSLVIDSFQTVSKNVFDSLSTHVKSCHSRDSEHRVMLHLNHIPDVQENELSPELSLLLALCPDQETWHHTQCTVLSQKSNSGRPMIFDSPSGTHTATTEYISSIDSEPSITNICHHAQIAHGNQQIFKIQLCGQRFWDMSDMIQPIHPEAKPTISLHHLLVNGMLRDRYRFFPNDKKILAYILARALFYLHESPWVQNLWTLNKIFFMYEENTGKVYNIHQPYISCILSSEPPSPGTLDSLHPYPLILAFAKLLLELETGEEVKSVKKSSRDGLPSLWVTLRDYCWNSSKHHLPVGYGKALEACVNFPKHLNQGRIDNADTTVQDIILKHIVHQLEREIDPERMQEWGSQDLDLGARISTAVIVAAGNSMENLTVTDTPTTIQGITRPKPQPRNSHESRPQFQSARDPNAKSSPSSSKPRQSAIPKLKVAPRPPPGQESRADTSMIIPLASNRELQSARLASQLRNTLRPLSVEDGLIPRAPRRDRPTLSNDPLLLHTRFDSSASLPLREANPSKKTTTKYLASTGRPASVPIEAQLGKKIASRSFHVPQPQAPLEDDRSNHHQETNIDSGFGYTYILSASETKNISSMSFDNLNDMVNKYWQHVEGTERIGIAILDTGIDLHHEDFQRARTKTFAGEFGDIPFPVEGEPSQRSRVKSWYNFCPDQDEDDVNDLDGHGTQVTGIILRLAPNVDLHIARICAGDINRGVPNDKVATVEAKHFHKPQPKTIEKAIRWAIKKGVSVINLSCGFRNCPFSDVESLKEALREAQLQNIVVFAATSNEGFHEPVAWPANDQEFTIGIHSCIDGGGRPSDFTAEPYTGVNFMVVGESILSQWPTAKGGGFRLATGSSFATPVAAAIGALVLEFVDQKLCSRERKERGKRVAVDDIRRKAGMIRVLKAISTRTLHGDNCEYFSINTKLFWKKFQDGQDARRYAWQIIEEALRL